MSEVNKCPKCGSENLDYPRTVDGEYYIRCASCGEAIEPDYFTKTKIQDLERKLEIAVEALELYANTYWTGDAEIAMKPAQEALEQIKGEK
jgi:hypothetical protein